MKEFKPGDRIALPKAVAKIYEAVAELERDYPGRRFTPDGHLVGSIGEVVARETFRFDLCPASTAGHDAKCPKRGDVQVKITAGKSVAFRGACHHLIALQIVSSHEAEIVYDGPAPLNSRAVLSEASRSSPSQDRVHIAAAWG